MEVKLIPVSIVHLKSMFSAALILLCFLFLSSPTLGMRRYTARPQQPPQNCRCAGEESFSDGVRNGMFKSPGFPDGYCDLLNCKWNIQPAADFFIEATFDFFETEDMYDLLEVYQTRWNGSELLKAKQSSLSGTFEPRTMERHFFSSVGGGLIFRFVTDSSGHDHRGFQISFRRHSKEDRLTLPCPPPFYFATPRDETLPLLSPNFRMDSSCIFVINSTEAVQITVSRFAFSRLSISVFETENFQRQTMRPRGLVLAKLDLFPSRLPLTVSSRTSSLTILLSTLQQQSTGFGASLASVGPFQISFRSTPSLCACFPSDLVVGRLRPTPLTSPGFPLEYCDNTNCMAKVALERPLEQHRGSEMVEVLRLRIHSFSTESGHDLLTLMTAPAAEGQRGSAAEGTTTALVQMSDSGRDIRQFTFDSAQFGLSFVSDHSIVDAGFNLSIEAIKKAKECVCPGAPLMLTDGLKHSEQNIFDGEKCTSMDCFWLIRPPTESLYRLIVKFNHTLADQTEFIEVYQGVRMEQTMSHLRMDSASSGSERMTEFDVSDLSQDPVYIWYHREWPEDGVGGEKTARRVDFNYEWRKACQCGETVLQAVLNEWKPLRSPDYPQTYCRRMQCAWRLEAPEEHHILLNVTEFSTEYDQDWLTIFDGNDTSKVHMEMLSGETAFTSPLHSSQPIMTLVFTSDSSIQMKGFELWFTAVSNSPDQSPSGTHRGFANLVVFLLFLALALLGFLFVRSNPTAIPQFAESRVRFVRETLARSRRDNSAADSTGGGVHNFGNPFYSPASAEGANPNPPPSFPFRQPNFS